MAFLIGCFVCACGKEDSIVDESLVKDTEDVSSTEEMLHMVNHYMDEYLQTDSLVAKAKAEKYAKIISKTVMNSGGFDSANAGQNAFFYDSAEGLITAVILVIAEFCSPYALALEQAKRKQKALEQRKKEIAQMRKACIDKDIDFCQKHRQPFFKKMLKQRFCFSQRNRKKKKAKKGISSVCSN